MMAPGGRSTQARVLQLGFYITVLLIIATTVECSKTLQLRSTNNMGSLRLSDNSITEAEGGKIQVNCSVDGVVQPDAKLEWELKESDKRNVKQIRLSNTTVALRITSLRRTNAGQYTCLLIRRNGVEEKKDFLLFVQQDKAEVCSKYQFKCETTKECLFIRFRCDNIDDCGDGSDEKCQENPCLNKFKCQNSRCVEHKYVCDHVDHCGDKSDEHPRHCNVWLYPTSTLPPVPEETQYAWLHVTVLTLAVTVVLVFLISFIIIIVFRLRMKRRREQRNSRALRRLYHTGVGGEGTASSPGPAIDQRQFLLGPSQPHYGNVIVNVNNGVQYIPNYDYAVVPPPYSEVGTSTGSDQNPSPPPPPYSTLERQNAQDRLGQTSEVLSEPLVGQGTSLCPQTQQSQHDILPQMATYENTVNPTQESLAVDHAYETLNHPQPECHQERPPSSGIDINSDFLQSLLGDPDVNAGTVPSRQEPVCASNDLISAESRTLSNDLPLAQQNHYTELTNPDSPDHAQMGMSLPVLSLGEGSISSSQHNIVPNTDLSSASNGGRFEHGSNITTGACTNIAISPGPGSQTALSLSGGVNEISSGRQPQNSLSGDLGIGDNNDDEYEFSPQNDEGTFLLRKSKKVSNSPSVNPSVSSALPTQAGDGDPSSGASNALINEVSRRDEKLKPKPGHLSVHHGEIVLHTHTGVLSDENLPLQPSPLQNKLSSTPDKQGILSDLSPDESGLVIKDGALLFVSPSSKSASEEANQTSESDSKTDTAEDGSLSRLHNSSSTKSSNRTSLEMPDLASINSVIHLTSLQAPNDACSPAADNNTELSNNSLQRTTKELQFKDGELVLESPTQTTSSHILSHLKGAYEEQEELEDAIHPVVNDKRSATAVVGTVPSRILQSVPKLGSDVVLPPKQ